MLLKIPLKYPSVLYNPSKQQGHTSKEFKFIVPSGLVHKGARNPLPESMYFNTESHNFINLKRNKTVRFNHFSSNFYADLEKFRPSKLKESFPSVTITQRMQI